ncbi:MAG: hypothetical protein C0458_05355 [Methylobacterium sp.]|nr:hypothetical protein [Methylobacterium sp.]
MSDLSAEKVVAELRARQRAHVGMHGNYYQYSGVDGLLDQRAAALIAQQAAELERVHRSHLNTKASRERWKVSTFKEQRRATAAEAERDRLREALRAAKGWLEGWASAERELAVIDAALSTAKERGDG